MSVIGVSLAAIAIGVVVGLVINVALLAFVGYFGADSVLGGFAAPGLRPSPP